MWGTSCATPAWRGGCSEPSGRTSIVSNGAGVAVPFFIFARLMRRSTVYIEVYDRIDSPTLTARICRPFTDLFCVQWPEQQQFYRGSIMVGRLL